MKIGEEERVIESFYSIKRKYRLDLQMIPTIFEFLEQMVLMWAFHVRFWWIITPRNLVVSALETDDLLVFILIQMKGLSFYVRAKWNIIDFVFSGWRVSLLALNQEDTLVSSLFIVSEVSCREAHEEMFVGLDFETMFKRCECWLNT